MKNKELPCPTCGQDLQLPADINAAKLAALREAGKKMAAIYTHLPKELRNESNVYYQILLSGKEATELMAALAEWEAANK